MTEAKEQSQLDLKPAVVPPKDAAEIPLAERYAQQVKRYLASEDAVKVTYDNPARQGRGVAETAVTVESEDGNTEITLLATDRSGHSGSSSVRAVWFDRTERTAGSFIIANNPNLPIDERTLGNIDRHVSDSTYEFMENGGCVTGAVMSNESVTRDDVERITTLLETGHVNADLTQKSVKVLQERYGAKSQPNALRVLKQSVSQPPSSGSNAAGGRK